MLVVLLQLLLQEYSYSERISLLAAVAMESVGMSDRVIATYHLDNPEKMIGHDGDLWRYFESYKKVTTLVKIIHQFNTETELYLWSL